MLERGSQWVAKVTTYIILGEQMERAEELVVLEIERAGGLEVPLEGGDVRGLDDELLGRPYLAELLVVVRG